MKKVKQIKVLVERDVNTFKEQFEPIAENIAQNY